MTEEDGTSGQDRESYTDDQDRKSYQSGDVVNGWYLGDDNKWYPVSAPPGNAGVQAPNIFNTPQAAPIPQAVPTPPPKDTSWVKWVVMGAVVALVAVIAMVGVVLTRDSDSNTTTSGVSSSDSDDGASTEDAVYALMDETWNQMSYTERQEICKYWNMGLDDMFMSTFMNEMGTANEEIGISDSAFEGIIRQYMEDTC